MKHMDIARTAPLLIANNKTPHPVGYRGTNTASLRGTDMYLYIEVRLVHHASSGQAKESPTEV